MAQPSARKNGHLAHNATFICVTSGTNNTLYPPLQSQFNLACKIIPQKQSLKNMARTLLNKKTMNGEKDLVYHRHPPPFAPSGSLSPDGVFFIFSCHPCKVHDKISNTSYTVRMAHAH